jgi:methylated-DNA-[protein]-cysteine S-methyltransferase
MLYTIISSPLGRLLLAGDGEVLSGLAIQDGPRPRPIDPRWKVDPDAFPDAREQLQEYFHGERRQFTVGLSLSGTPFEQRVWRALQEIPYGVTVSYGRLAARIGDPRAARAVGLANGRNPIAVVVPCHRVIGADGTLTGFGGGLARKHYLLELEAGVRPLLDAPLPA